MALTKVIGAGLGTVTDNVVITSDDPTITMTDSSGTNDIGTIQSASGALILTARDGSSDGEIIFKKTDGSATDETLRIKNSGNIGIGTNDPATQLHIENSSGNGSLQITSSTSGTSFINMGDTGDPDDGQISYLNSDLSMRFTTNAAEQVRIHSNGVLSASDGIALGVGTANTASNVLDDYEEGTWTATLNSSSNNATISFGNNNRMHYTKIGRMVNVHFSGTITNSADGSGYFQIQGLPFTKMSELAVVGSLRYEGIDSNKTALALEFVTPSSSSVLYLRGISTNATGEDTGTSQINTNDYLQGSITYFVA